MTSHPLVAHLTEEAFAEVRARPGFRAACDAAAVESVAHFQGLEAPFRWITKDIGRSGICVTAQVLDFLGAFTVQALTASCVERELSSPGRVSQVVRRCQEIGEITVDDGPGIWTRRPAQLGPRVTQLLRERWAIDFRWALKLAPELGGALQLAQTDAAFVTYVLHFARMNQLLPDILGISQSVALGYFLQREAGMLLLFELMGSQPAERGRFLEEAHISRYALSQRYGVSRAHINKVLAESGHTEAVGDRVIFSPELSDSLERHFSVIFQINIGAARVLLARHGTSEWIASS